MKTLDDLKHYLTTLFAKEKVYLFGSYAKGTAREGSDVDIAVLGESSLREKMVRAKLDIEDSLLPFKVDLVDLSQSPYLKKIVLEEGIVWH